jgi:DNA-binding XRE family transcriptional regulator
MGCRGTAGDSSMPATRQRRVRIEAALVGPQTASSSQALSTHGKKHTSLIAYVHVSGYRAGWGPVAKHPKLQSDLGNAIKELRGLRAITQEELASRTGLHPTYISDMERGARNPSFAVLVRLMRGLDMPVADLGAAYDRASSRR